MRRGRSGRWGLLAASLVLFGCPSLSSPTDRIRSVIERLDAKGVTIELEDGGRLEIPPGRIRATAVDAGGSDASVLEAFVQLEIEGKVGGLLVSYVGNERIQARCTTSCELLGPFAPRLQGVLLALGARREALGARDRGALAALAEEGTQRPGPTIEEVEGAAARSPAGWFIRVMGEEAVVGEAAPDGSQKRLTLVRERDEWRFRSGLP